MIIFSELIEQRNELEQMRRRMVAADLETNLDSVSSSLVYQVQVTEEGKHVATVGKGTSFEVSLSSPLATSSIPFPTEQLLLVNRSTSPMHRL